MPSGYSFFVKLFGLEQEITEILQEIYDRKLSSQDAQALVAERKERR